MSKFQVKLNQGRQGMFDTTTHRGFSVQRSVHLSGEKGESIPLKDGAIFEASNFFKRYCYPNCALEDASLIVLADDGSTYAPDSKFPVVFNVTVGAHSDCDPRYSVNLAKHGTVASAQITNRSKLNNLFIKFNKSKLAVLEFLPEETQSFGKDDFNISYIDFINPSTENIKAQILVSVITNSLK